MEFLFCQEPQVGEGGVMGEQVKEESVFCLIIVPEL